MGRGRPKLTPEQRLERQKAKIAQMAEKKTRKKKIPKNADLRNETVEEVKTTKFILTPAGECPVPLFGPDKEAIAVWVSHARNVRKNGMLHTIESLTYWLRNYFNIFSNDYQIAKTNLEEVCHEFGIQDLSNKWKKEVERINEQIENNKLLNQQMQAEQIL